jgi:uncharacterized membrane protein
MMMMMMIMMMTTTTTTAANGVLVLKQHAIHGRQERRERS